MPRCTRKAPPVAPACAALERVGGGLWRIADHRRQCGARIEHHAPAASSAGSRRRLSLLAVYARGFCAGRRRHQFQRRNGFGSGRSDLFQAGAFIRHNVGPAYLSGALAYGWQDVTTDRTVTVAGVDQLRAQFNANAFSGRVEGGYRFVSPWRHRHHALCGRTVHDVRSAGLCRAGDRPAPTPLRSPMARRASPPPAANSACAATNHSRCRRHPHPARPRRLGARLQSGPHHRRDLPDAARRVASSSTAQGRPATPR